MRQNLVGPEKWTMKLWPSRNSNDFLSMPPSIHPLDQIKPLKQHHFLATSLPLSISGYLFHSIWSSSHKYENQNTPPTILISITELLKVWKLQIEFINQSFLLNILSTHKNHFLLCRKRKQNETWKQSLCCRSYVIVPFWCGAMYGYSAIFQLVVLVIDASNQFYAYRIRL